VCVCVCVDNTHIQYIFNLGCYFASLILGGQAKQITNNKQNNKANVAKPEREKRSVK